MYSLGIVICYHLQANGLDLVYELFSGLYEIGTCRIARCAMYNIRSHLRHYNLMSDCKPRRRPSSLRITTRPVQVPIPPSLLTSPYLNSPESIFQREIVTPSLPSKADEQWLQDTVPLDAVETCMINVSEVKKGEKCISRRRSIPHLPHYDREFGHDGGWDRDYDSQFDSPEVASAPSSTAIRPCVLTGDVPAGNAMSPPSISISPGMVVARHFTDGEAPETSSQSQFSSDNPVAMDPLDKPPAGHRRVHSDVGGFNGTHSECRG
jgi:hypothetical protein